MVDLLLSGPDASADVDAQERRHALSYAAARKHRKAATRLALERDVLGFYEKQQEQAKVGVLRRLLASRIRRSSLLLDCFRAVAWLDHRRLDALVPLPAIDYCQRRQADLIERLLLNDNDLNVLPCK
jgi:hypothetical protein